MPLHDNSVYFFPINRQIIFHWNLLMADEEFRLFSCVVVFHVCICVYWIAFSVGSLNFIYLLFSVICFWNIYWKTVWKCWKSEILRVQLLLASLLFRIFGLDFCFFFAACVMLVFFALFQPMSRRSCNKC